MGHLLLTGASGFVGRPLLERLLSLGHRVVAVGRRSEWHRNMAARNNSNLLPLQGDLADRRFAERIWSEAGPFDGVFHYAAQIPAEIKGGSDEYDDASYIRNNVEATAILLSAVSRQAPIPFVYASSISLFGNVNALPIDEDHPACPTDSYGLSKYQGEEWVRLTAASGRIHGVSLRFPGMIGVGNDYGAVHLYASLCLAGQPISVYGDGRPQKDYIAVDDVVEASVLAMGWAPSARFEVFNVGGCQPGTPPPSLYEVAMMVADAHGGGDVSTNGRQPAAPVNMYFSNLKASRLLGYAPRPLGDRIREYVGERATAARAALRNPLLQEENQ
jgi:UDP-glucose 4-epimerase